MKTKEIRAYLKSEGDLLLFVANCDTIQKIRIIRELAFLKGHSTRISNSPKLGARIECTKCGEGLTLYPRRGWVVGSLLHKCVGNI